MKFCGGMKSRMVYLQREGRNLSSFLPGDGIKPFMNLQTIPSMFFASFYVREKKPSTWNHDSVGL